MPKQKLKIDSVTRCSFGEVQFRISGNRDISKVQCFGADLKVSDLLRAFGPNVNVIMNGKTIEEATVVSTLHDSKKMETDPAVENITSEQPQGGAN